VEEGGEGGEEREERGRVGGRTKENEGLGEAEATFKLFVTVDAFTDYR
jgi:hypothetical protein